MRNNMLSAKLNQILKSDEKLALKNLISEKLPAKTSLLIVKVIKKCQEEITNFYEVRNKKIIEYGEKLEGDNYQVKKENLQKFNEEILPLLNLNIELNIEKKLMLDELGDIKITPENLLILDWLIESNI